MGVWEGRAVVGHCTDHCVLWGTSAQQDCPGPFPLEGRTELLLCWPQYSHFLQACCVPGALVCFWGRDWEQNGCVRPQGLLADPKPRAGHC